jgi:hypothetical protein
MRTKRAVLAGLAILVAAAASLAAGCGKAAQPRAAAPGPAPRIALELPPRTTIVFLVDCGQASAGNWAAIQKELLRSTQEMDEDRDFQIVLYQTGRSFAGPASVPAPATDQYKRLTVEMLKSLTPSGESDPSVGLERALGSRPDLLYWLSTAEVPAAALDLARRLNADHRTPLFTVRLVDRAGEEALKQLSEESGGGYKFLTSADLAALTQDPPPAPATK